MNNKINLIQFLPYFPPHKGGVENVGEEISTFWEKNSFGDSINVITGFDQEGEFEKFEAVTYKGDIIGYKNNGIINLIIPSFELIANFPIYKPFSKQKRNVILYLKNYIQNNNNIKILTHTRFFLSSFFGGRYARKNKFKWIHLEHGSSFVELNSKFKSYISYLFDKLIGTYIFNKADILLAISNKTREFVLENFVNREIDVFYRGIDIGKSLKEKKGSIKLVYIGRLIKSKGVEDLIKAYKECNIKIELIIIGDGEYREKLERDSLLIKNDGQKISFKGLMDREDILNFLIENKVILVNPSYAEGLPTTVLEGLLTGNIVIASNVGGTKEISSEEDLLLFEAGNILELKEKILFAYNNFYELIGKSKLKVEEKFSMEKNINKLFDLIN